VRNRHQLDRGDADPGDVVELPAHIVERTARRCAAAWFLTREAGEGDRPPGPASGRP
jgi:hypothetical protein